MRVWNYCLFWGEGCGLTHILLCTDGIVGSLLLHPILQKAEFRMLLLDRVRQVQVLYKQL